MEGDLYKQYRSKIEWLRHGFKEEGRGGCPVISNLVSHHSSYSHANLVFSARRKKSRWGDEKDKVDLAGPMVANPQGRSTELLMYAQRVFGSTDLEEHQWKQCEDQLKVATFPLSKLLLNE